MIFTREQLARAASNASAALAWLISARSEMVQNNEFESVVALRMQGIPFAAVFRGYEVRVLFYQDYIDPAFRYTYFGKHTHSVARCYAGYQQERIPVGLASHEANLLVFDFSDAFMQAFDGIYVYYPICSVKTVVFAGGRLKSVFVEAQAVETCYLLCAYTETVFLLDCSNMATICLDYRLRGVLCLNDIIFKNALAVEWLPKD